MHLSDTCKYRNATEAIQILKCSDVSEKKNKHKQHTVNDLIISNKRPPVWVRGHLLETGHTIQRDVYHKMLI